MSDRTQDERVFFIGGFIIIKSISLINIESFRFSIFGADFDYYYLLLLLIFPLQDICPFHLCYLINHHKVSCYSVIILLLDTVSLLESLFIPDTNNLLFSVLVF